ncbi:MAG: hypothetical protein ACYC3L_16230 [Gemmatimonadaceae bacterium]
MKARWLLAIAAALIATRSPAVASAQDSSFIPSELAKRMKPGSRLDKMWIGAGFERAKGFAFGRMDYRADRRRAAILEYLPEELRRIATAGSPFTLDVAVTSVRERKWIVIGDIKGAIEVEGKVTNQSGDIVAVFRTHGLMPVIPGGSDPVGGVDSIISAIIKDLR